MNRYLVRLVIPCLLGVGGFGLNMTYVNQVVQPHSFLTVNQTMRVGDELGDGVLVTVDLPGEAAARRSDLFPAARRGEVVGRRLRRPIEAGELLFASDLDNSAERRAVPAGSKLIYVDLRKLAHEPSRLKHGTQVVFVVRSTEAAGAIAPPPTLGPFSVFREREGESRPQSGENAPTSLALLVREDDARLEPLRSAVRNDLLRGIEVAGD
ncbi:MAG: hypothetical protein U0835_20085 [Isosphaeraceae bacterium]